MSSPNNKKATGRVHPEGKLNSSTVSRKLGLADNKKNGGKNKRKNQRYEGEGREPIYCLGIPDNARFFHLKFFFRLFLIIVVSYLIFTSFLFAMSIFGCY